MTNRLFRAGVPLALGVAVGAALVGVAPAGAQDPPGNNGTVKVDGVDFDSHPDNEPHPGCTFEIDFYGFDEGDLTVDVLFEAIAPTGQVEPLLTDTVFIGEDDNSGGGSEAGLDASEEYDLTDALAGIEPHPEQGWHVKLTVNAEGSQGADTKFKVFWVSGCEVPPTTSTSSTSTTAPSTTSTTMAPTSTTAVTTPGGSTTVPTPGGPPSPDQTVGVQPTSSSGELPNTGSNSLPLVVAALLMVSVGSGVLLATRRLRTDDR